MSIRPTALLGYHTASSAKDEHLQAKQPIAFRNLNGMGYIPVVGIPVGIVRIIVAAFKSEDIPGTPGTHLSPGAKALMVGRGIIEILGAGLLFLIIDVAVSILRHCFHAFTPRSQKPQHSPVTV